MYERMLNKKEVPTMTDLTAYCGAAAEWFTLLNGWLTETYKTEQKIVFPYGNNYGWGVAHRKKQLICNIFAEENGFTVMVRLSDRQYQSVYGQLSEYAQAYIDNRYPCGDGGWIHYRVTCRDQLGDIQRLLEVKLNGSSSIP